MSIQVERSATQRKCILNHLQKAKSAGITAIDALQLYGCMRLAARIHEIRLDGHDVLTQIVEVNGRQIAKYILIKNSNELAK
jgi:hypothetical protein